jgi:periplasmic divalent cation tolerance protein
MRVLFSTAPPDVAPELVRTLVAEHLVACGNVLEGARSFYFWDGALQDDREAVVFMETAADRVDDAVARLRELHPDDVPKIVVLRPDSVTDDYLAWARAQTRPG